MTKNIKEIVENFIQNRHDFHRPTSESKCDSSLEDYIEKITNIDLLNLPSGHKDTLRQHIHDTLNNPPYGNDSPEVKANVLSDIGNFLNEMENLEELIRNTTKGIMWRVDRLLEAEKDKSKMHYKLLGHLQGLYHDDRKFHSRILSSLKILDDCMEEYIKTHYSGKHLISLSDYFSKLTTEKIQYDNKAFSRKDDFQELLPPTEGKVSTSEKNMQNKDNTDASTTAASSDRPRSEELAIIGAKRVLTQDMSGKKDSGGR